MDVLVCSQFIFHFFVVTALDRKKNYKVKNKLKGNKKTHNTKENLNYGGVQE